MTRFLLILALLMLPRLAVANPGKEVINRADPAVGRVLVETEDGNGTGSGFVVGKSTSDGALYFVTNRHVIEDAKKVVVGFLVEDAVVGFGAGVVTASQELDLALLKLYPGEDHDYRPPAISIYDEKMEKGDQVFALGFPGVSASLSANNRSPETFDTTVTVGNVNKVLQGFWVNNGSSFEQIQHTATINSGNSGGALLNYCGAVVGVNTAKITDASNVYLSSSSRTLAGFLEGANVPFIRMSQPCDANSPSLAPMTSMDNTPPPGPLGLPVWAIVAGTLGLIGALGGAIAYLNGAFSGSSAQAGSEKTGLFAVAKPAMMLAIRLPDGRASKHPVSATQLSNGFTIGRDKKAGITVASTKLSREHAKITLRDRKLTIEDMDSTNGGSVDGNKLTSGKPIQINSKSRIEIGDIQIKINPSG